MFKNRFKKVTVKDALDSILWNFSFIACNPRREHKGKLPLLGYHIIGEIILIILVIVDMNQRKIDLADFALDVMYFTVLGQTVVKLVSLYSKRYTFLKILNTVDILWDSETFPECKQSYESTLHVTTLAFEAYKLFFATALLMHIVVPVWYREQIIITWLPFDANLLKTSNTYLLGTALWQTATFGYSVWFSVIYSDCLFGILLTAAILQFRLLQHAFQSIDNIDVDDCKKQQLLLQYVDYHKILYEFVADIEDLFQFPIISQLMCCVFAMCVSAYLFADETNTLTNALTFLSYVLCNIFEMLLYCAASQQVQTEVLQLSFSIYALLQNTKDK